MALIDDNGHVYDTEKSFEEQNNDFKEYAQRFYSNECIKQIAESGYPDFNSDGSITFIITDGILIAEVTRIQIHPFNTENRGVKEIKTTITVK